MDHKKKSTESSSDREGLGSKGGGRPTALPAENSASTWHSQSSASNKQRPCGLQRFREQVAWLSGLTRGLWNPKRWGSGINAAHLKQKLLQAGSARFVKRTSGQPTMSWAVMAKSRAGALFRP